MLKRKIPYLERRSLVHGGEFPSSQVPCLKSTAFMPLALPSPLHPLPAKRTFIYTQMMLRCLLLLSGTVLDNLNGHFQECSPINKERGNLLAIPLKKMKVKIKIQEATNSFKTIRGSVDLFHL
jgi:hypothetical protein